MFNESAENATATTTVGKHKRHCNERTEECRAWKSDSVQHIRDGDAKHHRNESAKHPLSEGLPDYFPCSLLAQYIFLKAEVPLTVPSSVKDPANRAPMSAMTGHRKKTAEIECGIAAVRTHPRR